MAKIFNRTFVNIKGAFASLFAYEMIFKLFIGLCLIPAISFLFNLSLKISGYQYITKRNMYKLMQSPIIIVVVAIILILVAVAILIEIASLTLFYGQSFKENKHHMKKLLFFSIKELKRILNPKNIKLLLYVLFLIPVLHFIMILGFIISNIEVSDRIFDTMKDFKYYKVCIVVLLVLAGYVLIRYAFTFCYFFIEHKSGKDSFASSAKLVKGKEIQTGLWFISYNLFIVGIYMLFYLIVIGLVSVFTKFFGNQQLALTIFLAIFNFTNRILLLILGGFEVLINISLIVSLYYKYTGKDKTQFPYSLTGKSIHKKIPKRVKQLALAGIIILAILNTISIYYFITQDSAMIEKKPIYITSHRGNSISAPENTIHALQSAIDEMADYAEIDVQQTKDGIPVLLHDPNLKRTTGSKANIWKKNYDEIKDLDAGSWFSTEFSDARVPTLEEVIIFCKGKIKLNIELKPHSSNKNLEREVVRIIEENDFVKDCVITSFNYGSLTKVKKLNAEIKTGCILSPVYGDFYDMKYSDFYSLEKNFVTARMVYQIHQRGKEVHVWTVNSEEYFDKMEKLGVDNIITDDPVLARNTLYSKDLPDYTVNFLKLIFDL